MKIRLSVAMLLSSTLLLFAGGGGCMAATEKAPVEEEVCLIAMQDVPRMSVDELQSRLNDPSLIVVDVRSSGDWDSSSKKIKGAVRETLESIEAWAPKYGKDKAIVIYCA